MNLKETGRKIKFHTKLVEILKFLVTLDITTLQGLKITNYILKNTIKASCINAFSDFEIIHTKGGYLNIKI